ncbi:hypothetical protein FFA01_28220 [Frigoribacterium faeni]|uniref:Uncharacterized protein n=1 Tax=Frigoribacterium faeni TaxID=145483 RepID=A0ABQ0UT12_9MICO|nr:hypothetical protein FFA01_28220 [Frigoribacterium faeni]
MPISRHEVSPNDEVAIDTIATTAAAISDAMTTRSITGRTRSKGKVGLMTTPRFGMNLADRRGGTGRLVSAHRVSCRAPGLDAVR